MSPVRWSLWFVNATRRTAGALLPALVRPDDSLAHAHLTEAELGLYLRMDPRDRSHALAVARRLLRRAPSASPELVAAALLHDVGKSRRPYHPWQRIAAHLYTPTEVPAEPPLPGIRGAWQLGRHHDRWGAAMLRRAGARRRVAELVARHHSPGSDPEAQLLRRIDGET